AARGRVAAVFDRELDRQHVVGPRRAHGDVDREASAGDADGGRPGTAVVADVDPLRVGDDRGAIAGQRQRRVFGDVEHAERVLAYPGPGRARVVAAQEAEG